MIILADKRIPEGAKNSLERLGRVLYVETKDQTYHSISGHPDIFFCKTGSSVIHAPNAPEEIIRYLIEANVPMERAMHNIGSKYPETASLNAVVTKKYFIHNLEYSDPLLKNSCDHLEPIHVNQAYTRCNLLALGDDRFITSDRGIKTALEKLRLKVLYVDPEGIRLPGQNYGFIGGCCGINEQVLYILGSLNMHPEGKLIRNFVSGYKIIELAYEPLFDGGSVIFLEES